MRNPTGRIARREIRLLEAEVKMLEHYHSQCVEIFEDYQSEWCEDFAYFVESFGGKKVPPGKDDTDNDAAKKGGMQFRDTTKSQKSEESSDKEYDDIPAWAKKLYKKIAMIAHPDRISDEERRRTLEKVFRRASEAVGAGKYEELIAIALDFDISSGLDDITLKPVLKTQIASLKEKIQDIETEIPWVWGENFGSPASRCAILKPMLAREEILKSDEEIISAIKLREEMSIDGG